MAEGDTEGADLDNEAGVSVEKDNDGGARWGY